MAQTSSAMREPSMEEILASIRRIIEDSDITRQDHDDFSGNEKRGEVAPFKRPFSDEVAEIQTDAGLEEDSRDSGFVVPPLTLQAVLRGTLSDSASRDDTVSQTTPKMPVAPVVPEAPTVPVVNTNIVADVFPLNRKSEASDKVEAIVSSSDPLETRIVSSVSSAAEDKMVDAVSDAENDDHRDYSTVNKQSNNDPAQPVPTLKPLISEKAGQKVTAAFESLSDAVHAEHLRLVDAKTESLLRPMLQEWLDSNLPDLVERLVREEIERVVRGGLNRY